MVQPKYNPQEALERVKLMMKYDLSKTLNENKKVIEEQSVSQAAGGVAGGLLARGAGSALAGTLATTLGATGSAVPIVGTAAGVIIGYGLGTLLDWAANHDYGEEGFRQVMSACSAKGVDKLVPQLSKAEVRQIAYTIEDAKGQWNDDEDAIASALAKIPTIADLCAVDKKISGGLAEFLDDLTDSPDEWKMFTRPLAGMIEDTEILLTPEEQKKTSGDKKTGGYRDCQSEYTYGCKSPVIAKVQSCLGLTADGKFGPKTQKALIGKGMSSFKDSDVDKLCGNTSTPSVTQTTQDEFSVQVDADNPQNLINP